MHKYRAIAADRIAQFADADDIVTTIEQLIDGSFDFAAYEGDLADLASAVQEAYNTARGQAATDADVESCAQIAQAYEVVQNAIAEATAAATSREEALAALDRAVLGTEEEGEGTEGEGEEGTETEGAEGSEEEGTEGEEGEGEEAPAATAANAARGAALRRATTATAATRATVAPARVPARPRAGTQQDGYAFTATPQLRGLTTVDLSGTPDRATLGRALADATARLRGNAPSKTLHPMAVARTQVGEGRRLLDADAYLAANDQDSAGLATAALQHLLALRADAVAQRRFTASGGLCIAPVTDYGLTVRGGYEAPRFLESLPGFASTRPIQFYPDIELDLYDASLREDLFESGVDPWSAVKFVTAAQDEAGYVSQGGPTPDKSCVHISCLDPVTCAMEAVYHCLTFGNFQGRAWPEFVRKIEEIVLAGLHFKRDQRAQAAVLANPNLKIVDAEETFGAGVDVDTAIARLVASIRGRAGDESMPIDVYIPSWLRDAMAEDSYRRLMNEKSLNALRAESLAGWRERGVFINEYAAPFGTTTKGNPTFIGRQEDGALIDYPDDVRIMAWPTGTVQHQSAWELQIGLQETLYKTNDYGTFGEIAENVCFRGTQLFALDVGLCTGGTRAGSANLDCGAASIPPVDPEDGEE